MVVEVKARGARGAGECGVEFMFEVCRQRDIGDPATRRANQVVMMLGEILGQLEPRPLIGGDHPLHYARSLENGEVAVHRALGQILSPVDDLGDRQGSSRRGEHLDQPLAVRGVALSVAMKAPGRDVIEFGGHGGTLPENE